MFIPTAKVICASQNIYGNKLYTVEVKIHRFIWPEFLTHRSFSRNSASSRAIPFTKQVESVINEPALPLYWGSNKPGMQAGEELPKEIIELLKNTWLLARDNAVQRASYLHELGLHKQTVNRLLEPFLYHKVIISSTEWENFFSQRCHPDAQPEMRIAAEAIKEAIQNTECNLLQFGEWHLPYITNEEKTTLKLSQLLRSSVARCARVSYNNHDNSVNIEKDTELYNKLLTGNHYSPFEHVATPGSGNRNFKGFKQLRESID